MKKKTYIKPVFICHRLNTSRSIAAGSVELKTTNGLASDRYDILSKEAVWYEEDE